MYDGAKKTLKDIKEKETEDKEEEDVELTPHEHERALKGAYRSFMRHEKPKTNVDSYFDQAKPHIKTLIRKQLKEIGSAKDNHDPMGIMEEGYKVTHQIRPQ